MKLIDLSGPDGVAQARALPVFGLALFNGELITKSEAGIMTGSFEDVLKSFNIANEVMKGGPFTGPKGGKYADPGHKVPWTEHHQKIKDHIAPDPGHTNPFVSREERDRQHAESRDRGNSPTSRGNPFASDHKEHEAGVDAYHGYQGTPGSKKPTAGPRASSAGVATGPAGRASEGNPFGGGSGGSGGGRFTTGRKDGQKFVRKSGDGLSVLRDRGQLPNVQAGSIVYEQSPGIIPNDAAMSEPSRPGLQPATRAPDVQVESDAPPVPPTRIGPEGRMIDPNTNLVGRKPGE